MRIEDSQGNEITNLDEWAKLYDTPRQKHQWKEHRSAYSMAEFIMNRNGPDAIQSRISEVLSKQIQLERAIPEFEVRFDEFGHGRIHDLAVFGQTDSGESLFVGVEAKVDESFGRSVRDSYLTAKARQIVGESTNTPQRIEELLALYFSTPDVSMFDIRYQLLYATAGTLAAETDIAVFYVIVFKTQLYDELIGAENYRDYVQFMAKVGAPPLKLPHKEAQAHTVTLQGKELICIHEYFEI